MGITSSKYVKILTSPEETIKKEKSHAHFGSGLKIYGMTGLVAGALLGLLVLASSLFSAMGIVGGIVGSIVAVISMVIFFVVSSLIVTFFWWVGPKIIGGRGRFGEQYYYNALMTPVALVLTVIGMVFYLPVIMSMATLPFNFNIGVVLGLCIYLFFIMLVGVWSMFTLVHVNKTIHNLSTFKSIIGFVLGYSIFALILFGLIFSIIGTVSDLAQLYY